MLEIDRNPISPNSLEKIPGGSSNTTDMETSITRQEAQERRATIFIKQLFVLALAILVTCYSSLAQETNILNAVSPKLKKLLVANPAACAALSNSFAAASAKRSLCLLYFYSENNSAPRAFHYYPHSVGMAEIALCVRENQHPWDEFIGIMFELLNSRNEDRFEKLGDRARSGSVSRTEFVQGIMRLEFESMKATGDVLKKLKPPKKEISGSQYYNTFANYPGDFEGYLSIAKANVQGRDPMQEYGAQYDALRKESNRN